MRVLFNPHLAAFKISEACVANLLYRLHRSARRRQCPPQFCSFSTYREFSAQEMVSRARSFRDEMLRRRTVRQFSSRPVPQEVIEDCLRVARSAPSGANKQPWHFVVVSDAEVKAKIRAAAEEEDAISTTDVLPKSGSMLLPRWGQTKTSPI